MGEDRRDSSGNVTKLRYFYDIDGLCGIRYNGTNYVVVRNAHGDVVMLLNGRNVVAQYYYDAWGNCEVIQYNDTENIGNINPFRWKGHYYDVESGLYYANGSYYDPEVGLHVDASEISSIIDNAFEVFGLDRNGIMCDNILAYLPYVYSAFTTLELMADPEYDPDLNKPWWELAWNALVSWFASVVQWFNNLDVGWKIGIGLALFALACIITALTAGLSGGAAAIAPALFKAFLDFAIGVVSAFAFTAISMAITGDFSLETLEGAVADAIFWGGVFAFVSASVNAVKAGIRNFISRKPTSVIRDGVEIRRATKADFTDEAWQEIQSLKHNANGETISNAASGRKIHKGFKSGLNGKEYVIPGCGRADYFDKALNTIYELKPNNTKAIVCGINQLHRYNTGLDKLSKLVLIVY